MKVYEVIPISRGISKTTLSYFGPDSVSVGDLVSIPLRKKASNAIVIEKKDLTEMKSQIRSSTFPLKKMGVVKTKNFLPEEYLESAYLLSEYFASTPGGMLNSVIPKQVLESSGKISSNKEKGIEGNGEKFIIQGDEEERFANYKSFIREEFAKKRSVFFCLPAIEDVEKAEKILEKGIEQYTAVFHSGVTKKEFLKRYEIAKDTTHPILIIATVPYLSILRKDTGSIILDRENSRGYRTVSRPFFDLKKLAETFAKRRKIKYIVGDSFLSIEALWKKENDEFLELSPVKFRSLTSAQCVLIDMKENKDSEEKHFRVISPELEELIDFNKNKNQNLFILSSRKGLSPITVCGDCGKVVSCTTCGATLVLHSASKEKENFFLCHKCGEKRSSLEKCVNCGSWKLTALGIGIEKVENKIRKVFPDITIYRLDKETAKTRKKASEIVSKFHSSPGSILLGTEMALFYIESKLENVAIASLDSMFSVPDFRINERVFYLIEKSRSLAQNVFLVQTRHAENSIFEKAIGGNLTDFYREEIGDREKFNYPPFKIFVKISLAGKKDAVEKEVSALEKMFEGEDLSVFTGMAQGGEKIFSIHILMRFNLKDWPKKDVVEKLLSLPLQYKIQVDPDSLL